MAREFRTDEISGEVMDIMDSDISARARADSFVRERRGRGPDVPDASRRLADPLANAWNLWRRHGDAKAFVKLSDAAVVMAGGPDHAIASDDVFGNIVKGPVSFTGRPGQIRVAGFWTFNDLLTSMIPSTVVTPMPTLIFNPPTSTLKLAEIVEDLTSLML